MLPSPQSTATASTPARTRRPRAIQACNLCRAKKYKCDGVNPCTHCRKYGLECVFRVAQATASSGSRYSESYVESLERRLAAAEAQIAKARENESAAALVALQGQSDGIRVLDQSHSAIETQHAAASTSAQDAMSTTKTPTGSAETTDEDRDPSSDGATEVVDINPLTSDIEYHGNTSSLAFLCRIRKEYNHEGQREYPTRERLPSLVGTFHNHTFRPQHDKVADWDDGSSERFFTPGMYIFLDVYFSNLHYIHPIIDQESFLRRCEGLWTGVVRESRSFIALYYSVLSLGALIRTWTEQKINDMGRLEWSRMLFERAQLALGKPGLLNDLEAIQTLFIMAKVCQNELHPTLAYTYLGQAIRTALSVGINRNTSLRRLPNGSNPDTLSISKTWWGLYSLEVELSFALGRPDSLGMDEYHNRPLPPINDTEIAILPCMIEMSHITRSISVGVYLSRLPLAQKLARAFQIEADINAWVEKLPFRIRPNLDRSVEQIGNLSDPVWARVQRLVLQIRYHNVKMLLLRPFILHASKLDQPQLYPSLEEAVIKCTEAAIRTIETIYETCRIYTFFRTWWYNITYLTFAASILLFRAGQCSCPANEKANYISLIRKHLDLLDIMDENVVARKTADIVRQLVTELNGGRPAHPAQSSFRTSGSGESHSWNVTDAATHEPHHAYPEPPADQYGMNLGAGPYNIDFWDFSLDFGDMRDFRGAGIDLYQTF